MEHLPTIVDPAYPLPRIPCVCSLDDYDGQGMADFPERKGWRIDRRDGPVRFDETKSLIVEPIALLQAWFFFGLLRDVFSIGQTKIDMQIFQQEVEGQTFLSTAALGDSLSRLASAASELEPKVCLQRQQQARECFNILLTFLDRHWDTLLARESILLGRPSWNVTSILSLNHIMVWVILGETLKNAITQIWCLPPESAPIHGTSFLRPQNPFRDHFLQAGWCPNESSMLFKELDNTGLILATMLRRPFSDSLSHELCSDERCLALQTSDEDYETKHADNCLGCGEILVDQEKICSVLRCGGIPLIYIHTTEAAASPKVKLIDYSANSVEYFAISHVWAHGLGNPKENALPSCQLMRLRSLVGKLASKTTRKVQQPAFWIDTLCIPVDPKFKECRKLAVTRINDTFRQARQVLVLDADLQRSSKRCTRTELATRMICCGWMRRLWTLSEAVVADGSANASKVDVQFLEGSIEFNAIGGRHLRSIYNTETAIISIFSAFPQFLPRDKIFTFLRHALAYRTTSKLEDEAICLASILGFGSKDIALIAGLKTAEERMQLMYTLIGQIPASILFNTSKKLRSGFHWAPASLIGNTEGMRFPSGPAGRCDVQGLHVQFPGYVVVDDRPSSPNFKRSFLGTRYIGDPSEAAPTLLVGPSLALATTDTNVPMSKSALDNAIEFEKLLDETPTPAFVVEPGGFRRAALVSVSREEGSTIYATFKTNLYIRPPWKGSVRAEDWRAYLIIVREVSSLQQWCVQ